MYTRLVSFFAAQLPIYSFSFIEYSFMQTFKLKINWENLSCGGILSAKLHG